MLTLGVGQMWADYSWTCAKSQTFTANTAVSLNGVSWTPTCAGSNQNAGTSQSPTYVIQMGTNSSPQNLTLTTTGISNNISSITVNCSSKDGKHKLQAKVGTSYTSTSKAVPASLGNVDFTGINASGTIQLIFTKGTGNLRIHSISITYVTGTTHTLDKAVSPTGAGTVTLSATSLTESTGTATATASANSGYVFNNWSISGAGATLSSTTTNPTTVTMGTANATVTANFLQQVATPTLSVATGTYNNYQSVTLSCGTSNATIRYTTNGSEPTSTSTVYSTAIAVNATNTTIKAKAFKDGMAASNTASATYTLTCATPILSTGGTFNANQSVTITCGTTDAVIRYTTDNTTPTESSAIYNGAISVTQSTTIKAKAFKTGMNASGMASATYTLKCLAPTIAPDAGTKTGAIEVTMTPNTEGSAIHYTSGSNPSDPTGSSPTYSDAIDVDCSTTFKAIATKTGWSNSDVATTAYTIKYNVHWVVNGTAWDDKGGSSLVECGSTATLPTNPDPAAYCGHKFMGWTTVKDHDAATAPSPLITSAPTITGDVTYYAVFGYYEE